MLRDYQFKLKDDIYAAWQRPNIRNIVATMATGGGKTVVECKILREFNRPALVMAHRDQLVSQLALALNREQVPHSIIAPQATIDQIISLQIDNHGRSWYNSGEAIRVASVHSLARRDTKDRWYNQCALAIVDEGHHVTRGGIWEEALATVPNALGLFKTAHAVRGDGKGLGRHNDGLADAIVTGPHGRYLIDRGYLCDYRIICPPSDIDVSDIPVGQDFNQEKLAAKIHASKTIVGDIVAHYLRVAPGKLGLTFVVDVEEAHKVRAAFQRAGVPAEVITAKTPISQRAAIMRRFRARQVLQLVSVDVLGEGTDVPAVEVVSLGRHTFSWQLFCQQVGRVLRPYLDGVNFNGAPVWDVWDSLTDAQRKRFISESSKPMAIIIDHVDNFRRHYALRGTFDSEQVYTLDKRESRGRKSKSDAVPLRICLNETCFQPYEAHLLVCPYCGMARGAPARRGSPEQVEGDLYELDSATLKIMRGELVRVDGPAFAPESASAVVKASVSKHHLLRTLAQGVLRPTIALWAGWQKAAGLHDREIQRLFWYTFGVDVLTAQTLGEREAGELQGKIQTRLDAAGIVPQ